jgi:hypothetical protein
MDHSSRLFFIVGRGRSGSTLLVQFLDAHPSLAMAPEALFAVSLYRRYGRATWDDKTVRRFSRDLWHEDRLRRWGLNRDVLERDLQARPRNGYADMCARVYAAAAASRGKAEALRLGDKNPHHALFVPVLMEIFPHARFIHLVRDYRDTILSYQSMPFDASAASTLAMRWRLYNEAVLAAAVHAPDRFLRVRFEDLVAEPATCLRGICHFLGVEWTPVMMADRQTPYYGLMEWHRRLAEPLDRGQAGKWRTDLAPRDIAVADAICQPLGERFGYLPHAPREGRLRPAERLGAAAGRLMTIGERALMRVPLGVRAVVMRTYRRGADDPTR